MALIECKDVSLGYEGKSIVTGLNFEINEGDYLCIIGENGSGKSTLAKSLLGDTEMSLIVNEGNVAQWIKDNCKRYDVIIDEKYGKNALDFIEGMLHYMYNPKYEGRTRRRNKG